MNNIRKNNQEYTRSFGCVNRNSTTATILYTNGGQHLEFFSPTFIKASVPYKPEYFYPTPNTMCSVQVDERVMNNLNKIKEIARLKDNWDGDGAMSFPQELISKARRIIAELWNQPEIFPTGDQAIQMEYDGPNGSYLEIELREKNRMKIFEIDRNGKEFCDDKEIDIKEINKLVVRFYE